MLYRFVARPLGYLLALLLVVLLLALAYRGYSQFQWARATAIASPNGIDSLEQLNVRGDPQWIYLRGHDVANPVMLFLHGGPGMPELPIARVFGTELENHFTVVHWDQRGAGKSRHRALTQQELTVASYLADVEAVVGHLRERFGQEKIVLVGHSWGSLLGVLSVRDQPAWYHAYVGIGQIANMMDNERLSLEFVRNEAVARKHQRAQRELAPLDPAQYGNDFSQLRTQRKWLFQFGGSLHGMGTLAFASHYLLSPEYSLADLGRLLEGSVALPPPLWGEVMAFDLMREASVFTVPVVFFAGAHDYNTPTELARRYFDLLDAPQKVFVEFPASGHMLNVTSAQRYQEQLIEKVLPLVSR